MASYIQGITDIFKIIFKAAVRLMFVKINFIQQTLYILRIISPYYSQVEL
jgi:hypothetical protein